MDIQEELRAAIHRIDGEHFLEEVIHMHSRAVDYWLGTYGKDQRVWLGGGETMTREEAMEVAQKRISSDAK